MLGGFPGGGGGGGFVDEVYGGSREGLHAGAFIRTGVNTHGDALAAFLRGKCNWRGRSSIEDMFSPNTFVQWPQ